MKSEEFAYCLACWMSPGVLARAADDWSNPPEGHEIMHLSLISPILTTAKDARFDSFVQLFLKHVSIPEDLVQYTFGNYPSHVTPEAAKWLQNFKYTGSIKFDPDDQPQFPNSHTLATISAPTYEIRVVWPPLNMLNELVSNFANYWRQVASVARPEQVHHEPSGEWTFLTWIDLQVARACGFPSIGRAGIVLQTNTLNNVRGHVSVVGPLPKGEVELNLISFAAELHPKSKSKGFDLDRAIKEKYGRF